MSRHGHVYPLADAAEHDTASDEATCVCGPDTQPVVRGDGTVNWLIVHHSLDGREREEEAAR